MEDLKLFFKLLNVNLTNVFQNLGDVVECVTKEGAYCVDFIDTDEYGDNRYLAIAFEETAPPAWDIISTSTGTMTEEQLTELVMETIQNFIDKDAISTENEWNKELLNKDADSFFFYDHEETFDNGLGI